MAEVIIARVHARRVAHRHVVGTRAVLLGAAAARAEASDDGGYLTIGSGEDGRGDGEREVVRKSQLLHVCVAPIITLDAHTHVWHASGHAANRWRV